MAKVKLPRLTGLNIMLGLLCFIILSALVVIGWLAWNFQGSVAQRNLSASGAIPVSRDFAPGGDARADVLFRIGGDAVLARDLMPDLVAAWMRQAGYSGVGVDRDGIIQTVHGSKHGHKARVLIAQGSNEGGFTAMTERRIEAVISSRQISASQADKLSVFGDMSGPESEKVLGLDAEVVLVNRSNHITAIDTETLARILRGEITDWSEVNQDEEGPIEIKLMGDSNEAAVGFAATYLDDAEVPKTAELFSDPKQVASEVASNRHAIGLTMRADARGSSGAKVLPVAERNARLVEPDDANILSEAYPLTTRITLYVNSVSPSPELSDFAHYVHSIAGQTIVARQGFLDTRIKIGPAVVPVDAPRSYAVFARQAQKTNFDVRFLLGANELDSRSFNDLTAFIAFVRANQLDPRRIALLGFADNVGAVATNIGLAKSRAERVAKTMEEQGISPGTIQSFGEAMPVGANSTEQGRIRNRRVEIWVCGPPSCPLVDISSIAAPARIVRPATLPSGVRLGPQIQNSLAHEEAPKG